MTVSSWERLAIEVDEPSPRSVRLCVRGDVDVLNNARLREALRALYQRSGLRVGVDLTHARLRDSTPLVTLIAARRRLAAKGSSLTLTGLTQPTRETFARAGLTRFFRI